MPSEPGSDRFRFQKGWTPASRLDAQDRVRALIADGTHLLPTSEALAEGVMDLFAADACTVSLLDEHGYHDLVNVGRLAESDTRFPDQDHRFPLEQFPLSTGLLLAGSGYLSANSRSELYEEFQGMWPQMPEGSFLGAPIVAAGQVRGELYLARGKSKPAFTAEDLEVARDLATSFGSALPRLLDAE